MCNTHRTFAASVGTGSGEAPAPLSSSALSHTSQSVKESDRLARVIFDFAASSPFELNVTGLSGDIHLSCMC